MSDMLHVEGEASLRPIAPHGSAPDPCALVIFGATGDLAARKLIPAVYNLAVSGGLPPRFAILGVARRPKEHAQWQAEMRAAVEKYSRRKPIDEGLWARVAQSMRYVAGSFEDPGTYARLGAELPDEILERLRPARVADHHVVPVLHGESRELTSNLPGADEPDGCHGRET